MWANITAETIKPLITGFDEANEYIAVWDNASWGTVEGLWNRYMGTSTGSGFTIHTFDVLQTYLDDGVGSVSISMDENTDIDYDVARTVTFGSVSTSKGNNYTGYVPMLSTIDTISELVGKSDLIAGEVLGIWDKVNYVWNTWIVDFSTQNYDVSETDVIWIKASATRQIVLGE